MHADQDWYNILKRLNDIENSESNEQQPAESQPEQSSETPAEQDSLIKDIEVLAGIKLNPDNNA